MLKTCFNLPGYFVDQDGNVYSNKRKTMKKLIPKMGQYGYLKIGLYRGFKTKQQYFQVHCLVAEAFFGKRPKGLVIRHLDGNRLNNKASNLKYGTAVENIRDTMSFKRHPHLDNHPMRKLSSSDIKDIKQMLGNGETIAEVAREFEVSHGCISDIFHKRTWRDVKP